MKTRYIWLLVLVLVVCAATFPSTFMVHDDGRLASHMNFFQTNLFAGSNVVVTYDSNGAATVHGIVLPTAETNITNAAKAAVTVAAGSGATVTTNVTDANTTYTVAATGSSGLPSAGIRGSRLMVNPASGDVEWLIPLTSMEFWFGIVEPGWVNGSGGGGAAPARLTIAPLAGEGMRSGFWKLTTYGTNTSEYSALYTSPSAAAGGMSLGSNTVCMSFDFSIEGSATNCAVSLGLTVGGTSALGSVANFLGWYLERTNWVAVSRVASVTHHVFTGPAPTTNQWLSLGFSASTNSVVFYTNGVPCATNSDSSKIPNCTTVGMSSIRLGTLSSNAVSHTLVLDSVFSARK